MAEFRELTKDEREALEAFAAAHKRKSDRSPGCATWRDELSMIYWYNARIWRGPVEGMGTALHGIRNEFGPTWLYDHYKEKPAPKPDYDNGPWGWSGPEEGDGDDTVLVCNNDADHFEVIEIRAGTLAKRKSIARRIARLLNEGEGRLM